MTINQPHKKSRPSDFSYDSETGRLKKVLLKHPREAFIDQTHIQSHWKDLNYQSEPDFDRAVKEYEAFVGLLADTDVAVCFLPRDERTGIDSIYVRDCILMTSQGVIILNMGKSARSGEPSAAADFIRNMGIPVLGAITGEGRVEGGDVVLLDAETLLVGQGYRTNAEGIRQLRELTKGFIREFRVVALPHWKGPDDVLHLMSFLSPLTKNLALVYSPLMPVPFRQWLLKRGLQLVEVPGEEYDSMACNVLALGSGRCLMLSGNPETKKKLQACGLSICEYRGEEISRKGAGGPTCLTRPLHRLGD